MILRFSYASLQCGPLREKSPNTELYSFGPNTGKYGQEKTPYLDTSRSDPCPLLLIEHKRHWGTVNESRRAENVNMDPEMNFFVILSSICNFAKLIFMISAHSKNGAVG